MCNCAQNFFTAIDLVFFQFLFLFTLSSTRGCLYTYCYLDAYWFISCLLFCCFFFQHRIRFVFYMLLQRAPYESNGSAQCSCAEWEFALLFSSRLSPPRAHWYTLLYYYYTTIRERACNVTLQKNKFAPIVLFSAFKRYYVNLESRAILGVYIQYVLFNAPYLLLY